MREASKEEEEEKEKECASVRGAWEEKEYRIARRRRRSELQK